LQLPGKPSVNLNGAVFYPTFLGIIAAIGGAGSEELLLQTRS